MMLPPEALAMELSRARTSSPRCSVPGRAASSARTAGTTWVPARAQLGRELAAKRSRSSCNGDSHAPVTTQPPRV